jgi:hypothetical protein
LGEEGGFSNEDFTGWEKAEEAGQISWIHYVFSNTALTVGMGSSPSATRYAIRIRLG